MDKILVECEDAGTWDDCEGEVDLTICPYAEDVHGEIVPVWLCEHHYHERIMDI